MAILEEDVKRFKEDILSIENVTAQKIIDSKWVCQAADFADALQFILDKNNITYETEPEVVHKFLDDLFEETGKWELNDWIYAKYDEDDDDEVDEDDRYAVTYPVGKNNSWKLWIGKKGICMGPANKNFYLEYSEKKEKLTYADL